MAKADELFPELKQHDSEPSVPITDLQRIRLSEAADILNDTRLQGYIEANFGIKALEVLKEFSPILSKLVGV